MNHVQTSLARAPYNIDDFGAYQAAALSVRDNLIVSYDLLGCLKISARIPPLLMYTIIGVSYSPYTFYPLLPLESQSFQLRSYFLPTIALCTVCECDALRADIFNAGELERHSA